MPYSRWWHVAVFGVCALMTAILLTQAFTTTKLAVGLVGVGVLLAAWLLGYRRAFDDERIGVAVIAAVVASTLLLTIGHPALALSQAIAMPLAWSLVSGVRRAIAANVAVVLGISAGYVIGLGPYPDVIIEIAIIEGLSLAFTIAFGLWISRIHVISAERAALVEQLQAAQAEVAALGREAGATGERERWARELHDTIAQDLTGVVLLAQRARREAHPAEALALLEESARRALDETRALVAASAPLGIDAGLGPALERLADRFARETGLDVEVEGAPPALPRDLEVVLLRVAQEGLANARKHAGAERMRLRIAERDGGVRLVVADDGAGFDPDAPTSGFGLAGMRERLALAGGRLEVASGAGRGTELVAWLPTGSGGADAADVAAAREMDSAAQPQTGDPTPAASAATPDPAGSTA